MDHCTLSADYGQQVLKLVSLPCSTCGGQYHLWILRKIQRYSAVVKWKQLHCEEEILIFVHSALEHKDDLLDGSEEKNVVGILFLKWITIYHHTLNLKFISWNPSNIYILKMSTCKLKLSHAVRQKKCWMYCQSIHFNIYCFDVL